MNWIDRFLLFSASLIAGGFIVLVWGLSEAAFAADPIVTESTSTVTTQGSQTTKVESPPPSAIAPQVSTGASNDICVVGASGALQTQILGISLGGHVTDETCVRLRTARVMFDLGMKVAAVSVMCTDPLVFASMERSGSPCPASTGLIGKEAQAYWEANPQDRPYFDKTDPAGLTDETETAADKRNKALAIIGGIFGSALLF